MLFNVYLWTKVPKKRLFGTLRVLAYGLVVSAGLGALTVRNAVADGEEQSLQFGRRLADVADLLQSNTELRLNGQRIFFSNGSTDESVSTVLDRFEANCNSSKAFTPQAWEALQNVQTAQANSELKSKDAPSRLGLLSGKAVRKEDSKKGDGMVMCFTSDHSPRDFFSAIESFEKTGDLHDLGDVRYVHATPHTNRNPKTHVKSQTTLVQTVWTDGSFNIRTLIGTSGTDAPGSDFATLPRPMDSVRRFTADAVGQPYAARVYESKATPEQVLTDYNTRMLNDNWVAVQNPTVQMPEGRDGRWYTRFETGEQAALAINEEHGRTMVVVATMGVLDKAPLINAPNAPKTGLQ